jgi:hypothetical protein
MRLLRRTYVVSLALGIVAVSLELLLRASHLFEEHKVYSQQDWQYPAGSFLLGVGVVMLLYLLYGSMVRYEKRSFGEFLVPTVVWFGVLLWQGWFDIRILGPRTWEAVLDRDQLRHEFWTGALFYAAAFLLYSIGPALKFVEQNKHPKSVS